MLVLQGGTLIDGTGRRPIADALVVVEGTRIKAVGTRGQVPVPPAAAVIELDGRTILPGLIHAHVHLRDYQVPMFLPYGVTTIADIHNDTEWSLAQRDALNNGRIKGPRTTSCAPSSRKRTRPGCGCSATPGTSARRPRWG